MARKNQLFKTRTKFSALDVKYISHYLNQKLEGLSVGNIYDLNA